LHEILGLGLLQEVVEGAGAGARFGDAPGDPASALGKTRRQAEGRKAEEVGGRRGKAEGRKKKHDGRSGGRIWLEISVFCIEPQNRSTLSFFFLSPCLPANLLLS
jgi:hypothetical protein